MNNNKKVILIFFAVTFLESMAANFAHPVTPTIIKNLNLNDYMFGVAFAGMAFTNFLFSPFWGKISNYYSSRKLLLVGCSGYGAGQILFSLARTEQTILLARCFSGFFIGAIGVSTLIYIVDTSPKEEMAKNLTILATLQSVGAAFGYLVGGVVGVTSISVTFGLQALTLISSGILFYIFLGENKGKEYAPVRNISLIKEANPFHTFLESKVFMNKSFAILFLVVLFANLGTNAFDQCFNYYIKDQFQFTSAYNGLLKAMMGIITLIANSTICMWILRKVNVKKATSMVLACCAVSIAGMLSVQELWVFVLICTVFFTFNAIYIPLLQDCVAKDTANDTRNMIMGFYNAMKSLGMIGGALAAGFIYGYGSKLPFVFAGACFVLSALFLLKNTQIRSKKAVG